MSSITMDHSTVINDRYELGLKICETSLGTLYKGIDRVDNKKVLVEVLGPIGENDETVERFLQEIELISSLKHPNIVCAVDAGWDNHVYFLVTLDTPGKTLEDMLKVGKIQESDALNVVASIINALDYVWKKKKIIHRDIKPQNIYITHTKHTILTGFGIAKSSELGAGGLTGDGFTLGTPEYMSPEQIRAEDDLDFRTDMYSLGCVLYEALTGVLPFADTVPILIINRHLDEKHTPVIEHNSEVSPASSMIVDRLLAKDRRDRYESWSELLEQVNIVQASLTRSSTTVIDTSLFDEPTLLNPNSGEDTSIKDAKIQKTRQRLLPEEPDRKSVVNYLLETSQLASSAVASSLKQTSLATDKYQIKEEIASGGMGKVILAKDFDLNRKVAMKTILPRIQQSPHFVSKFIEEAQTVGQLEHPNIVPIYDMGIQSNGQVYFTMKLIKGNTLKEVIEKLKTNNRPFHELYSWTRRAQIIQQICDAIQFAHSKGIIHRDLKPANVMIGEFGEVIVMDWGLAKLATSNRKNRESEVKGIEESSVNLKVDLKDIQGTPSYMSPEQVLGRRDKITSASDIYAIGVLMYELFSLHKPYVEKSPFEVLSSIIKSDPLPIGHHKPQGQKTVPTEIQYIIRKAMQKQPQLRHTSAAELKEEIQLYLNGKYPIRCPHTALKRCTMECGHLVDNHGRVLIISILIPVIFTLVFIVSKFF